MPLHLIKLCVGCSSVTELEAWIEARRVAAEERGEAYEHAHVTRMVPSRAAALSGGSLYWVIKGQIACRQRLLGITPFTDGDGIGRCRLLLDPAVIGVAPRPCRPFQGWRYLEPANAPGDLVSATGDLAAMPEAMRRELAELGLL